MSRSPGVEISTVHLEVPITLASPRRSRSGAGGRDPVVVFEVRPDGCSVWDNATYTVCAECYTFRPRPTAPTLFRTLIELPHFDAVFRYVSEQYAANKNNPVGKFLHGMVIALETALAGRDGSCVYFAEAGGRIKIGWSRRVASRLAALQTANAEPVKLLGVQPGGRAVESRLHAMFADARLSGEWFAATPDLTEYIAALPTNQPAGIRKGREPAEPVRDRIGGAA